MPYHWRRKENQSRKDRARLIKDLKEQLQKLQSKDDLTADEEHELSVLAGKIAKYEQRQNEPFVAHNLRRTSMFVRPSGGW